MNTSHKVTKLVGQGQLDIPNPATIAAGVQQMPTPGPDSLPTPGPSSANQQGSLPYGWGQAFDMVSLGICCRYSPISCFSKTYNVVISDTPKLT